VLFVGGVFQILHMRPVKREFLSAPITCYRVDPVKSKKFYTHLPITSSDHVHNASEILV
jgi:hypothetical protein